MADKDVYAKYDFLYWLQNGLWYAWLMVSEMVLNAVDSLGLCSVRKFAHLPESLKGKIVVITGANTGIGKETVKEVVKRGAEVYLACRDQTRTSTAIDDIVRDLGNDSLRSNLHFVELNLSSLASVRAAAAAINKQVPHIDVLLNNAGVMMCPEWTTEDGFEHQLGTNHFGHFLFTQLLMDKLKAAPDGARLVNVSSLAHVRGIMHFENLKLSGEYSPESAYGRSKVANIYFTRALAKRLGPGSRINVYALHPGIVTTELMRHLPFLFRQVIALFRLSWINVVKGAQTSLYCAFDPAVANQTGLYYANCTRVNVNAHVTDDAIADRLWELSLKLCDVQDRV